MTSVIHFCGDHSRCNPLPVPFKFRTLMPEYSTMAYVGVGVSYEGVLQESPCYLQYCGTRDGKIILKDTVGNEYMYERKYILAYVALPELPTKTVNLEKIHTIVIEKNHVPDINLKCIYCNKDATDYHLYYKDNKQYCTGTCGNICLTFMERNISDMGCVECGGGSGLFKQSWLGFQNEGIKRTVKFRYCFNCEECRSNITEKFQKTVGVPISRICDYCGTPEENVNLKVCGKCSTARYCNKTCQIADWPQHKKICKSLS